MQPQAVSAGHRTRRRLSYAAVITVVTVVASYRGVLPVFRSHLMEYLGIGDSRFGLLFSIGSLTGLGGVLFGGHLIDRWGPRRVIRICLVGMGCAMVLVALGGPHFLSFAVSAGVSGVFAAPLFVAVSAYLAKLFPRHQRRVISLNLALSSLGGMMFPILAEGLLYLSRRLQFVTFAQVLHLPFALTGTLLLCASFIYRRKPLPAAAPPSAASSRRWQWRDLLLPPRAFMLACLISLHGTADTTLHMWMPRFLESRSFTSQLIAPGVVLSGFALAYLLARAALAALPDRIGRRAFLVLPGLAGGSILIAGILSRRYTLAAAGYVLGAFCWSVEYPTMVSMLIRNDKKRFGASMAVSGLLGGLMRFASMNLMGILIQRIGDQHMWKVMLIPAAGFPLVGIGGLAWLALFDRQPAQSPTLPLASAGDQKT